MSDTDLVAAATLEDLTSRRLSCRAFRPDPVPRTEIETLLAIAQRTPSWCNTQPWRVLVTSGAITEELREGLPAWLMEHGPAPDIAFPPTYEGVAADRRRETARQLYESVGIAWGDRAASGLQTLKNFSFFGAPHLAVITTDAALGTYGVLDCGLYIAHFLLAAESLGLGAIAQAAIATASPYLRERFDLPDDRQVVCGISFGHADHDDPVNAFRTARADLGDVVTWAG